MLEVFLSKAVISLVAFARCTSLTTTAQIEPNGSCGCGVSSSSVGCSCSSDGNNNEESAPDGRTQLIDTLVNLSPDAILTRWVPEDDQVIIGMGDGQLANDAKSPPVNISVSDGSIFFMPKDEPYKLRNIGKQDVKVRVIRIHHAGSACPCILAISSLLQKTLGPCEQDWFATGTTWKSRIKVIDGCGRIAEKAEACILFYRP